MMRMLQRHLARVRGHLEGFPCSFAPAVMSTAPAVMSTNPKFGKFVDLWPQEIVPSLSSILEELKSESAEGGVGVPFNGTKVLDQIKQQGEARNISCNIMWTPPLRMSKMGQDLSFAQVEKFAKSQFWANDSTGTLVPCAPKNWIRGLSLPIAVYSKTELPKKHEMERIGLDLVVAAFYYSWAMARKMELWRVSVDFHSLARSCVFDFIYVQNEDKAYLEAAQNLEQNEMLRSFFGLDQSRLIQLATECKNMVSKAKGNAKTTPLEVAQFMEKEIKWHNSKRIPSEATVKQLLDIGAQLQKSARARLVMALAENQWQRDTIFDEYSKVLIIVQKSSSTKEFDFIVEGIYSKMARTDNKDQLSKSELSSKAGEVNRWSFLHRYSNFLWKKYPMSTDSQAQKDLHDRVHAIMISPLKWLEEFGGGMAPSGLGTPHQDISWTAGLNPAMKLMLGHVRDLYSGTLNPELCGMLGSPPPGGPQPSTFLAIENIKTKFHAEFESTYSKMKGAKNDEEGGADSGAGMASSSGAQGSSEDKKEKKEDVKADLKEEVRSHAADILGQRLIIVDNSSVGAGLPAFIQNSVAIAALCSSRMVAIFVMPWQNYMPVQLARGASTPCFSGCQL